MELNKIYNMDCLEYMKTLPDNSIHCIVTSPPYNLGGDFHTFVDGKRVTYGDYVGFKDKLTEEDYQQWQIEVLNECYRILKEDGFMFYNHKNRIVKGRMISPIEWLTKCNFTISQCVVMDLGGTANVDKRRFFPVHENIYVLTKTVGQKLNNHECFTDVWRLGKVARKKSGHPATFTEELPRRCIVASTNENDIVLDPFCGTGTTTKVAKELGRKFIGCEISKEYFNKAVERTENLVMVG